MALNFPSTPTNGQTYTSGGVTWTYSSGKTAWYNNFVLAGSNTNIIYNDSGYANATSGFTYDESTNNVFIANTLTVGTAYVGANVTINTSSYFVGNSTVNSVSTSTSLKISNSTVNAQITIPTAAQWTGGNYYLNANGSWSIAGGSSVTIANTAPGSANVGDLWWDKTEGIGQLYIWYDDGDTQQWVQATPGISDINVIASGSNTHIQFNDSGVVGGTVGLTFDKISNNVTVGNTVTAQHFDNVSDISLKENITPLTDTINILNLLNPVSFDWKNTGEKSFGLIAQEVEEIIPEIVHSKDDNMKTVSYIQLIPLLIQVIKDQQEQINNINNKINA